MKTTSKSDLQGLLNEWHEWAKAADRDENGWESDFPAWPELLRAAHAVMTSGADLDAESIAMLDECWSISEEDEELSQYAVEHIHRCWPTIQALASAAHPASRWQAYEAASRDRLRGESILRKGLSDPDLYARRRAIFAFARLRPTDAKSIAEGLLENPDSYIRQAAIDMTLAAGDSEFQKRVAAILLADDAAHVRAAAAALLT